MTTRHRVCRIEDVPEGGVTVFPALGAQGIGIFNLGGRLVALNNRCPHAGARVCEGWITGTVELADDEQLVWARDGEILRCPWHGWEFEIETGCTVTDPSRRVKRHPVHLEDGWVHVDV